jgi:hypothetical protein
MMRGRWAAGIVPRNFAWIIRDRLAVSERPGGQAPYHRRVRRQEEILWLRAQQFTRVVSLLGSTHNLHAYDELGMTSSHFPIAANADLESVLGELYPALHGWLRNGERVLLHQEELGDRLAGVIAGFLCWSRLLPEPPRAVAAAEQLMRRQLGAAGRSVVAVAVTLPPPEAPASPAPFGPTVTSAGVPATGGYPPPPAARAPAAASPATASPARTAPVSPQPVARRAQRVSPPAATPRSVEAAAPPPARPASSRARAGSGAGAGPAVSAAGADEPAAEPAHPRPRSRPAPPRGGAR